MILSRDTPTEAVISPLLPLNGCAKFVEKVFSWDEDKNGYSTEFSRFSMWANAAQGSYLELQDPKYNQQVVAVFLS